MSAVIVAALASVALASDVAPEPPDADGTVRHAIVIGANDGGLLLEPLRYAEQDASKLAAVLTELGDFAPDHVTVLYAPTPSELRVALQRHAALAAATPDDLFLFYYSGHADARGLRLGADVYAYADLKGEFRAVDATVRIGMLDACRSGAITRLKGASLSEPLYVQERLAAEGEAWMTASSADELAQESDTLRGGFFTHYVVSGLRGAADAGDGRVDLHEVYRYAYDRVVEHTGGTDAGAQHPHFDFQLTGAGELALTDLRRSTATLVLPEDLGGHVSVLRLPDRSQIVELQKDAGAEKRIAVPPGTYLLRRRIDGELSEVTVGVPAGGSLVVYRWAPVVTEEVALRGLPGLPTTPEPEPIPWSEPVLAGMTSIVPGGGQLYRHEPWKAGFYFGSTSMLLGGSVIAGGSDDAANLSFGLGLALWGAAMADAVNGGIKRERPYRGVTLSTPTGFGPGLEWALAVNADFLPVHGMSIGLDRVGLIAADRGYDLNAGTRMMLGWEWKRLRPGAFAVVSVRHGPFPADDPTTRLVFGGGVNLRYYVVPRYFLEAESRMEGDGAYQNAYAAVGMGIHLGR